MEPSDHINELVSFLVPFNWLWSCHVVDFCTNRLWELVDPEWLIYLRKMETKDLILLPSGQLKEDCPNGLQEFVRKAKELSLVRIPADSKETKFPSVLAQGMNPKKRHEISKLAHLVSQTAETSGASHVIDFGAGQGYLSLVLSFCHNLKVVAIDTCDHHSQVTIKRAHKYAKYYNSPKNASPNGGHIEPPVVLTQHLDLSTASASLSSLLDNLESEPESPRRAVLVGLHACGDLSVNLIRTFLNSPDAAAMVSVACCYNLLTESMAVDRDPSCGFPTSQTLREKGFFLGKSARDLACQSAQKWEAMDPQEAEGNFRAHGFRAAFEVVLSRYFPDVLLGSHAVGRLGKASRKKSHQEGSKKLPSWDNEVAQCDNHRRIEESFMDYVGCALERLSLPRLEDQLLRNTWHELSPFIDLVGPFWTLRAVMAPILESLILVDRLQFLIEESTKHPGIKECMDERKSNMKFRLFPLFDPYLSPRNVVLVATKS